MKRPRPRGDSPRRPATSATVPRAAANAGRPGTAARATATPPAGPPSPAREWLALALVIAAAAWLRHDVLQARFFADDFLFLDSVRGRGLFQTVFSRDPLANYLRPISRQLWFWVMARVANESPVPFYAANLALLLGSLVLLQRIARKFVGALGATVACALLALHYSADVPLHWASGSQDLLALDFALGALLLHLSGRRALAAITYLCGLLSKETVALTPVIAFALEAGLPPVDPKAARPKLAARARTLIPMLIAAGVWLVLWFATRSLRTSSDSTPHVEPGFVLAAAAHYLQTLFGLEWGAVGMADGWKVPPIVPTLLVLGAIALAAAGSATARRGTRGALLGGAAWALCGLVPIATVAPIWSAYFYLFAVCGGAIAIGALLSGSRLRAVVAALLFSALLARAGAREEFATAPGAWNWQSHVTRFYIERATRAVAGMLDQLRAMHPTLARNTTLFFGGVPPNLGWQTADGPLFRWAYHDPTIRSYFIADFTRERAARGPSFYFDLAGGKIKELWAGRSPLRDLMFGMLIEDRLDPAHDALSLWVEDPKATVLDRYTLAWIDYARGRVDSARAELARIGFTATPGHTPDLQSAYDALQGRADTTRVIRYLTSELQKSPFNAGAHALLADVLLSRDLESPPGQVEAFAARSLAPQAASTWRRWAIVQLAEKRHRQAAASLDRYFQLGGVDASADSQAVSWRKTLRDVLPGGSLAQQGLRTDLSKMPAPPH